MNKEICIVTLKTTRRNHRNIVLLMFSSELVTATQQLMCHLQIMYQAGDPTDAEEPCAFPRSLSPYAYSHLATVVGAGNPRLPSTRSASPPSGLGPDLSPFNSWTKRRPLCCYRERDNTELLAISTKTPALLHRKRQDSTVTNPNRLMFPMPTDCTVAQPNRELVDVTIKRKD